ncbi:hypothetical protein BKA69DRAFT_835376 [Paraphysoderma sedebokerense]|nr:hypothetical protein BKA69DRAFT_835376 [Paraphysoderma sedebokerense]
MSVWAETSLPVEAADAKWHPTHTSLAVSTAAGSVNIFNDEGDRIGTIFEKNDKVTTLTWSKHPTARKICAVGYQSGFFVLYLDSDGSIRESKQHSSAITCLKFSSNTSKLISGDEDGKLIVWKLDHKCRLFSLCTYHLKSAISHCLFATVDSRLPDANLNPNVYVATVSGGINCIVPPGGSVTDVFQGNSANAQSSKLSSLLWYSEENMLLALSASSVLTQIRIVDGKVGNITQIKLASNLSSEIHTFDMTFATDGLLAICNGSRSIRFLDLKNQDSQILDLPDQEARATSISFDSRFKRLAVGTNTGIVFLWKLRVSIARDGGMTRTWDLVSRITTKNSIIKSLSFGPNPHHLCSISSTTVQIWTEQTQLIASCHSAFAVQVSMNSVVVVPYKSEQSGVNANGIISEKENNVKSKSKNDMIERMTGGQVELTASSKITGLCVSTETVVVCTDKVAEVWNWRGSRLLSSISISNSSSISGSTSSRLIAIDESQKSIYISRDHQIDIYDFNGIRKNVIDIVSGSVGLNSSSTQDISSDQTGSSIPGVKLIDLATDFLAVVSTTNSLCVFDISKREPVALFPRKDLSDYIPNLKEINMIKINGSGKHLAMFGHAVGDANAKLFVHDFEQDRVSIESFKGTPLNMSWDNVDPRVLFCEVEGYNKDNTDGALRSRIHSFICSSTHPILQLDIIQVPSQSKHFLSVSMPYIFFSCQISVSEGSTQNMKPQREIGVLRMLLNDFIGMPKQSIDIKTVSAMMDFRYWLCLGNMDEAFKSIKSLKSDNVWKNLAQLCVKTGRLDVALICLGNMKDAKTARLLRQVNSDNVEAKIGILAAHLGMMEDAETILSESRNYSYLSRLYQVQGKWDEAIKCINDNDRINIRNTYYRQGKWSEQMGEFKTAIDMYEKAGVIGSEIPRMLLGVPAELEKYVKNRDDKDLMKWWAQYLESKGNYDDAIQYYESAGDTLSVVRIHCYRGNLAKAIDVTDQTAHPGSQYHLAHYYESNGKIKEAIQFYAKAKCFTRAVRLAKENELKDELLHLALLCSNTLKISIAKYYESIGCNDKAVTLYHKGGNTSKALEVAYQTEQFEVLRDIVESLGDSCDKRLLENAAEYMIQHQQYDKAVSLLVSASKVNEALDICLRRNVILDEELATKLSTDLSKYSDPNKMVIITKIADVCMSQENYHLACKMYTQAGDRIKAIKALLKTGDTEKIMVFASISGGKQKEILIIAANYLQTLDWRSDANLMKNIVAFYTKAKAFENLAGFFEACAQVEIDEYQNYEKALGALKESIKCMSRAKTAMSKDIKINALQHKIDLITKFVQARKLSEIDQNQMNIICGELLKEPNIEQFIRIGDIFALLIETAHANHQSQLAFELLQRMMDKVPIHHIDYYLDPVVLESVDPGFKLKLMERKKSNDGDIDYDVVEENIGM